MNYLVTGGSGYLGSHLVRQLLRNGHKVTILDDLSGTIKTDFTPLASTVVGDICGINDLDQLQDLNSIDGIFHLAAKKSVPESLIRPEKYLEINANGTARIIQFGEKHGIRNLVMTSSAAVYGELDTHQPIDEKTLECPINPYGSSKLLAESIVTNACNSAKLSAISLRTFNIVGAVEPKLFDSNGENVLPIMAKKLLNKDLFTIFGNDYETSDGTCVRDYVNVQDVARAHMLAMKYLENNPEQDHKIINICSSQGISILELIDIMSKNTASQLRWTFGERRLGDASTVIGEFYLAKNLLDWEPKISIEQSIQETLLGSET